MSRMLKIDDDCDVTFEVQDDKQNEPEKVGTVRYTVAYMGFFGFFLVYAMRINMSVALVDMVEQDPDNSTMNNNCPVDEDNTTSYHSGFNWSNDQQADVLGAFYYGYLFTQFPAGILATKFGAKYIFGLGVLITAILTLLTPPAANLGVNWLIGLRVIEGVTEGVTYPSFNVLLGVWAPKYERSVFSAFTASGGSFGNVIVQPIVGYLCSLSLWDGWPIGFYVTGVVTIIWFLFWVFLIHETPRRHPRISEPEILYIESNVAANETSRPIPWKDMLTSGPLYGVVIAYASGMWINYGIMSCLPQYLSNVLNFDITSNGFISAAPWLSCWISAQMFSYITDKIAGGALISTTALRKMNQLLSTVLPAIFLVLAGYAGCDSTLAVVFIVISMFFFGFIYSGCSCNNLDLAPQYAGVTYGIINTFGTIPGFLAPKVVALMTDSDAHSVKLWREVFYVFAAVAVFGGISFLILGSGELQYWAKEDDGLDSDELLAESSKSAINESDDETDSLEN